MGTLFYVIVQKGLFSISKGIKSPLGSPCVSPFPHLKKKGETHLDSKPCSTLLPWSTTTKLP